MLSPPSSFCSICTHHLKHELVGFLLSLSVHHSDAPIYLFLDGVCDHVVQMIRPYIKLRVRSTVNLDGLRSTEELSRYRKLVMDQALIDHPDVCLLDVDGLLVHPVLVDKSKELSVSEGLTAGSFLSGVLWTKNKAVPQRWIAVTLDRLVNEFSHALLGDECNLTWRRVEKDPEESVQSMLKHFKEDRGTRNPLFKNKPIVFVHTRFGSNDRGYFNAFIFNLLMQCRKYKECAILQRVMHHRWIIHIPKQPLSGIWFHNDDGFRELARIWESTIWDVRVNYSTRHLNCFLEPNVCFYDRWGSEWLVPEVHKSPMVLFAKLAIESLGNDMRNHASSWIGWYQNPMVLEDFLKSVAIYDYAAREVECAQLSEDFKVTNMQDGSFLAERSLNQRDYLRALAKSRFVMCSCGSEQFTHIDIMAVGTVPILRESVITTSFREPLIEGLHYIKSKTYDDIARLTRTIDEQSWKRMSQACERWYATNAHSSRSWIRTLRCVLYNE